MVARAVVAEPVDRSPKQDTEYCFECQDLTPHTFVYRLEPERYNEVHHVYCMMCGAKKEMT